MRNLMLAVVAVAAGCAASSRTVEVAKTARYRGDKLMLFATARTAVEAKYTLTESDETTLRITTAGRWYTPEGLGASERDMHDVRDRSVHLRMIVRLVGEGDAWLVAVDPIMMRYFTGRPNPDLLAPDDPSVPGWAHGRVDQLYAAIHDALQSYAVVSPGGMAPASSAAPAGAAAASPPDAATPAAEPR